MTEVVLERVLPPAVFCPRYNQKKEETLLAIYQMNPTDANRSRYQSRKVENMKALTADRLIAGAKAFIKPSLLVECYKTMHAKIIYSSSVLRGLRSPIVAVRACNMFLSINYPTVCDYRITDEYDAYLDMVDGSESCLDRVSFCPAKLRYFPKQHSYHKPTIDSAVPSPFQNTLQNVLAAAMKRNCNVTQMRELPVYDSAVYNVECFKKYACNDEYWKEFSANPITLQNEDIRVYVAKLKGPKAAALFTKTTTLQRLEEVAMDRFVMDMKRDVKVVPGTKHTEERPKVQVIQAADAMATAYLCGIHRELVRRLKAVLRHNIHTLFDMSAEDFDAIIGEHFMPGDPVLETDIASFDKSQDDAMALTALMILEDLGVDTSLMDLIEVSFGEITSVHLPTGTRFRFGAMMKSGMFLTLFVNTILNVVIASRILEDRLTNSRCAAFIGDDNIIHGVVSDRLMADRCATWMNMEVKIIDAVMCERPPYFCGGFILWDCVTGLAGRVSDPLKRLFKLGKPLPADDTQDNDRCRAVRDEVRAWRRVGIQEDLQIAMESRYGITSSMLIIDALEAFSHNLDNFKEIRGPLVTLYGGPK